MCSCACIPVYHVDLQHLVSSVLFFLQLFVYQIKYLSFLLCSCTHAMMIFHMSSLVLFDCLIDAVFCFPSPSYPVCHVGVHHFLHQMCAFCTRIASLCPCQRDLHHHATARRRPYSGVCNYAASILVQSHVCFLISSLQSHSGPTPVN